MFGYYEDVRVSHIGRFGLAVSTQWMLNYSHLSGKLKALW